MNYFVQKNLGFVLGLISSLSESPGASKHHHLFSTEKSHFLREVQFSCFPWVESQLVVHPCQALTSCMESLSSFWGRTEQWWEAMEVACLICGKLCLDFSFIPWCSELVTNADAGSCVGHICLDGAQLLGGHSQREEICPLLVQSLPFLFPGGEAAVHWEKIKAVDISDGSKVTLTRKWGHLSYRISRHLGPFWNLQKQKAEDWEPEMPSSWNMERFILYGCNMGKLLFLI